MKLTLKDILFIVILAILILFLLQTCNNKRLVENQNKELLTYTDSVSFYKTKTGELAAYNKALKISSASQVKGLEEKLKNLKMKDPIIIVEHTSSVKVEPFEVRIDIPCEDFTKPILIDSTDFKIGLTLSNKLLKFDSITIPNKQTIAVGDLKKHWWKSSEYSVVITNSNKHLVSTGLQSYTITPEKKFYQTGWFWSIVGFVGGAYIGNQLK